PGPCPQSLVVNLELPTPFTCTCSEQDAHNGAVWGTDTYTADSDLCRAAVHAGTIPRRGGTLTVEYRPGLALYVGSQRNGVASHDFGAYSSSIRFR
ncbi:LCCL domain-containing protein, partial [Aromatoleum toluolicum]